MARFSGIIGFAKYVETSPGVHEEQITERRYSGDVLRDSRIWEEDKSLHDNIRIGNRFSVVADSFVNENVSYMRYVKWMGVCWKITNVEIQRPRLIFSIGDKYNG